MGRFHSGKDTHTLHTSYSFFLFSTDWSPDVPHPHRSGSEGAGNYNLWCQEENAVGHLRWVDMLKSYFKIWKPSARGLRMWAWFCPSDTYFSDTMLDMMQQGSSCQRLANAKNTLLPNQGTWPKPSLALLLPVLDFLRKMEPESPHAEHETGWATVIHTLLSLRITALDWQLCSCVYVLRIIPLRGKEHSWCFLAVLVRLNAFWFF